MSHRIVWDTSHTQTNVFLNNEYKMLSWRKNGGGGGIIFSYAFLTTHKTFDSDKQEQGGGGGECD